MTLYIHASRPVHSSSCFVSIQNIGAHASAFVLVRCTLKLSYAYTELLLSLVFVMFDFELIYFCICFPGSTDLEM